MSLDSNLQDFATDVGTNLKALRTLINGNATDLSALTTASKTNLVAAINEVRAAIASASSIDDAVTGATTTWSSSKIDTRISAAVASLVAGAPEALDTLSELATALEGTDDTIAGMLTTIGTKANDSAVVHLTGAETIAGIKSFSSAPVVPDNAFAQSKVNGLTTALAGKAATSHTHTIAQVTNLQTTLDGKAATGHTHTVANVTGLQDALDAKASTTALADVSGTAATAKTTADNAAQAVVDLAGLTTDYVAILRGAMA